MEWNQECVKCGVPAPKRAPDGSSVKKWRAVNGWTSFILGANEYWLCPEHKKDK